MAEPKRRTLGERRLAIAAGVALALVGGGALFLFARRESPAASPAASAPRVPAASPSAPSELGDIASSRATIEHAAAPESAEPAQAAAQPTAPAAPERAAVTGVVVDARELAVAGVAIEAWHPADLDALEIDRDGAKRPVASATTDAVGGFWFEVPPGEYVFSFGEGRFSIPELGVQTIERAGRRLDLKVPELTELEVTVLDDAGIGAADVEVRGWSNGTGHLRLRTDAYGRASARYLPAGEFRVLANDAERGRGDLALVLAPGRATRIELPLRRRKIQ